MREREDLGGASIDAGGGGVGKLGTSRNFGRRARVVTPDPGFVALKSPAPRVLISSRESQQPPIATAIAASCVIVKLSICDGGGEGGARCAYALSHRK